MTPHPQEQLAPYVDGTASAEERAVVEAHVRSCARCRDEIAAATAARAQLQQLPIEEAPAGLVPTGLTTAPRSNATGTPAWYRWGGAVAAAAVIVLLMAMVLPRIGRHSSAEGQQASGAAANTQISHVPVEVKGQDFGGKALGRFLESAVPAPQAPVEGTIAITATPKVGTTSDTAAAQACLTQAFGQVPGTLVRLISAPYDGKPAYLGIYEQPPANGQVSGNLVARVASARTCTVLTLATRQLGT